MMDYEMQKNHLGVSGDPPVDHDLVWRNALGLEEQKSNGCLSCCMGIPGNILEKFSENYRSNKIAEL
jgi:hypothetical protein